MKIDSFRVARELDRSPLEELPEGVRRHLSDSIGRYFDEKVMQLISSPATLPAPEVEARPRCPDCGPIWPCIKHMVA